VRSTVRGVLPVVAVAAGSVLGLSCTTSEDVTPAREREVTSDPAPVLSRDPRTAYLFRASDELPADLARSARAFVRFAAEPSARTAARVPFARGGIITSVGRTERHLAPDVLLRPGPWFVSDGGGTTSALFVVSNTIRRARVAGEGPPVFVATSKRPPVCAWSERFHPRAPGRVYVFDASIKTSCATEFRLALDHDPSGVLEVARMVVRLP
jgi:hypothetical protein